MLPVARFGTGARQSVAEGSRDSIENLGLFDRFDQPGENPQFFAALTIVGSAA